MKKRLLIELSFLGCLVGLMAAGYVNRLSIQDAIKLFDYRPDASIVALADDTTMTPEGRHDFYVNHPVIQSKTDFAPECNSEHEQTIVLGCYHSNQQGIFLLTVTDSRLSGVEQVTAAHEMLHAAYDRLSAGQRSTIDAELEDYYNNLLTDPRIKATIAAYKKSEPNDVVNEMHSVFGTEVADLPPSLEAYYKQYFTNRHKITSYAAQYEQEFTSRQQAVSNDDTQLASIKAQIDSLQATLTTTQGQLAIERQTAESSHDASTVAAYNTKVDAYNQQVANLKQLITRYNDLVEQRNTVALQQNQLVQSISTSGLPNEQ